MSKTLLIDANSIFYAAQHATKLNSGGLETQAAFGAIKTARELRVVYPDYKQVWCHDTKATWRFKLHPEYKSGRSDSPQKSAAKEALSEQRPYIARAFEALGLRQITVSEYEADDIIGLMSARLAADSSNDIGIISGDRDLIQLVKPNVWWRDMRDDSRQVNWAKFYDKTGCPNPYAYVESKALQGDSSDVISGVGGIGEKGAPEFIAEFGSVRQFWQRCDSGDYAPKKKALIHLCSAEGRAIFGRNLRLMQLLKVAPPAKEDVRVVQGTLDKDNFAAICGEMAFLSILKNVDNFCSVF